MKEESIYQTERHHFQLVEKEQHVKITGKLQKLVRRKLPVVGGQRAQVLQRKWFEQNFSLMDSILTSRWQSAIRVIFKFF